MLPTLTWLNILVLYITKSDVGESRPDSPVGSPGALCGSQGTRVRAPGAGRRGIPAGRTAGSPGGARPKVHSSVQQVEFVQLPKEVLPRKEVIQPHVPVRLPCYDFTPLALHTFDASLTRLGRRLRVQTTRVV